MKNGERYIAWSTDARNVEQICADIARLLPELGHDTAAGHRTFPDRIKAREAEFRGIWAQAELRQRPGACRATVAVAGRIMAIRAQGKAGFATLQQGGQRLQIYVRLDAVGEQGFALYKLLDLGDHIGAHGLPFPHPHQAPRRFTSSG